MVAAKETKNEAVSSHGWVPQALADAKNRQSALGALKGLISEAESVWSKISFPSQRLESWKYTSTDAIANGAYILASAAAGSVTKEELEQYLISDLCAHTIVFVDGVFAPALSSSEPLKGLRISRFADGAASGVGSLAPHNEDAFAALATALITDGISLSVERGVVVSKVIHLMHVATAKSAGCVVTPRVFVHAEEGAQLSLIESYVSIGSEKYLSLPVVEIAAESGAIVDYYKNQHESESASHISNTIISQGRSGSVSTHIFSFGGALVRNNVSVLLKGSGASAVLNGLSVLHGDQHVDNSTLIHHIEPTIESREHFKGIYADTSRGVFSGTITVEKIAQKTNAFQSNQALLLSPTASIETRPQLKIWADDVKCTHGATVGQLDDEAMFYLRSRGIGAKEARNFLIHAFASEVLTSVKVPALKERLEAQITGKLGQ